MEFSCPDPLLPGAKRRQQSPARKQSGEVAGGNSKASLIGLACDCPVPGALIQETAGVPPGLLPQVTVSDGELGGVLLTNPNQVADLGTKDIHLSVLSSSLYQFPQASQ